MVGHTKAVGIPKKMRPVLSLKSAQSQKCWAGGRKQVQLGSFLTLAKPGHLGPGHFLCRPGSSLVKQEGLS